MKQICSITFVIIYKLTATLNLADFKCELYLIIF